MTKIHAVFVLTKPSFPAVQPELMKQNSFSNTQQLTKTFQNRSVLAAILIFIGLVGLVTRYAYLQVTEHEKYKTQSESNRIKLEPIGPSRGYIYDRNGILLADNKPVFSVMLSPNDITDIDDTLKRLTPLFDLSEDEINDAKKKFSKKRKRQPITLKIDITEEQLAIFSARKPYFKGVYIGNKMTRVYPYGKLFAHVIGYVGRINDRDQKKINENDDKTLYAGTDLIGKLGIEKHYEKLLLGQPGHQSVEADAYGKVIRSLDKVSPTAGNDLYLSLDYGLQVVADKALRGRRGAVVAIDPRNGDVLAFVSNPSFDPNPFVSGISFKAYKALNDDIDQPLYNRALQGQYPPASTIKPFEGLGGIHYGLANWHHRIHDKGYFTLPGDRHRFRDWAKRGHGAVGLGKSVWMSCDTYYYQLAHKMGIQRYHDWMIKFGFGSKTGIDLPYEKKGVMPSPAWKMERYKKQWLPGDTISASIGQGYFLATPLQIATATAITANKGQHITPHLLKRTEGAVDFPVIDKPDGKIDFNGTDKDWENMHQAMIDVVRIGTGRVLQRGLKGYQIAGKTGTAQVKSIPQGKSYQKWKLDKRHWDHALFMGFAPAKNPRVAVGVIVENGQHGSKTAGPVAKAIFDYVVHRMDKDPILPPNPNNPAPTPAS